MAITKDKGAIGKYSGGSIYLHEVNDAGGSLEMDTPVWQTLGYIQESNLQDNTDIEDYADETGNTVASEETNRLVKVTGLLMQSDKDVLDFFKETVRGKYYAAYKYEGVLDGVKQEIFLGICKVKPQIDLASGVKRIPYEMTVLKNTYDIVLIDTSQSDAVLWEVSGSCTTNDYVYVDSSSNGCLVYQASGAIGDFGSTSPSLPADYADYNSSGETLTFVGYGIPYSSTFMNLTADAVCTTINSGEYYQIVET